MSLGEKARRLEEDYGLLPDPQDRFQYLIEQSANDPGLTAEERISQFRIHGCTSQVWVIPEFRDGRVYYRTDGDSPVVKALAWILADFYSGETGEAISQTPPAFLERLGLTRALTENRRRGLRSMIERFQVLARGASSRTGTEG